MTITTTTHQVEGRTIHRYCGIVSGEAIMGANMFRDFLADISDSIGGRVGVYERKFEEARQVAMRMMVEKASRYKASAVVGVAFSYQAIGEHGSILMVAATGTAVIFEGEGPVVLRDQFSSSPMQLLVMVNHEELGPFDESGLASLFTDGTITDETSACIWSKDGKKEWKPLGRILGA